MRAAARRSGQQAQQPAAQVSSTQPAQVPPRHPAPSTTGHHPPAPQPTPSPAPTSSPLGRHPPQRRQRLRNGSQAVKHTAQQRQAGVRRRLVGLGAAGTSACSGGGAAEQPEGVIMQVGN